MAAPSGSLGYINFTIDKTKVGATAAHQPILKDLSGAAAAWWANISERGDIVVWDGANIVPCWIDNFSAGSKTGILHVDAAPSTVTSKVYQIHAVPSSGQTDAAATFTNSSCVIRHSMDGADSPLVDSCGNYNLTLTRAIAAQAGQINKSLQFDDGLDCFARMSAISELTDATKWTCSWLLKPTNIAIGQNYFVEANGYFPNISTNALNSWKLISNSAFVICNAINTYLTAGSWNHCVLIYDGAGANNAAKLKLYINNVLVTWTSESGTIPTSWCPAGAGVFDIGYFIASLDAFVDEMQHYTVALSAGQVTTLYNDYFDANTVVLGAWVSPSSTSAKSHISIGTGM